MPRAATSETDRKAAEEAHKAEDDAKCRATNTKPGETAYDALPAGLGDESAPKKAVIDYQKARDFDRVLGGLDDL